MHEQDNDVIRKVLLNSLKQSRIGLLPKTFPRPPLPFVLKFVLDNYILLNIHFPHPFLVPVYNIVHLNVPLEYLTHLDK